MDKQATFAGCLLSCRDQVAPGILVVAAAIAARECCCDVACPYLEELNPLLEEEISEPDLPAEEPPF